MMQNLQKKLEADGKTELELFDKYTCWYQTVKTEKTATNKAARRDIGVYD